MSSLPLSVCCMTNASPDQTLAALSTLRTVAAEIVIGVDARRADQAGAYGVRGDRVLVMPEVVDGTPRVESHLAALHAACKEEWVFRLDADEIASPGLVAALPTLVADDAMRQYRIARRWLSPDGSRWIDEVPWWPDYQTRLVRKDGATFSGELHSSADPAEPSALVLEPIYHADCALTDLRTRQDKVVRYAVGSATTTFSGTGRMYEPERFARRSYRAVPSVDLPVIEGYLRAAGGALNERSRGPSTRTDSLGVAVIGSDTPEVAVVPVERDAQFVSGLGRSLSVEVTNHTRATWEGGPAPAEPVALAYHWRWADGHVEEGGRSAFPHLVAPGATCVVALAVVAPYRTGEAWLDIQVVHEHVRWLDGGARVAVTVEPPEDAPTERRVVSGPARRKGLRRRRQSPAIPQVIHRIWLGAAEMPEAHREYGESWERHHPGWEVRLWTDADAPAPKGVEAARNVAERADLVRYEVLRRHGGVYVDTDVECLRPLDDLLDGVEAFAAYEVPGRLCNAVIGAVPHHPAFERAVELVALTVGRGTYPQATATEFLTYVLEADERVTLFGPDRFYPVLWDDELSPAVAGDPPHAIHHWAMSWCEPVHR